MSTILFRADANSFIGMGHIMRCLSIADAVVSTGCQVRFIIADDTVSDRIYSRGYKVSVLRSDYKEMNAELNLWPELLDVDFVFVDSYYVTPNYLSSICKKLRKDSKGVGKLVYLDDILAFPYPVDILVNYNAYANQIDYERLYAEHAVELPQLMLGSSYTPLRSMFRGLSVHNQPVDVKHILISTGGSDELHLSLVILQYLRSHSDYESTESTGKGADSKIYHFLIGTMNTDKEDIHRIASEIPNIILHENVTDMRSLIQSIDLVVSAAGSTMYEIAACGVPLITYSLANNQVSGGEAFQKLGIVDYVGDLRDPESIAHNVVVSGEIASDAVERIFSAVEYLSSEYNRRVEMGHRMQELIDGRGSDRLVKEILCDDW